MKTPRTKSKAPAHSEASPKVPFIAGVLAAAAPLIAVLQSPALAGPGSPNWTDDAGVPRTALDPPSMIAAGTAIATLGAYQLMKARARKKTGREDSADS